MLSVDLLLSGPRAQRLKNGDIPNNRWRNSRTVRTKRIREPVYPAISKIVVVFTEEGVIRLPRDIINVLRGVRNQEVSSNV